MTLSPQRILFGGGVMQQAQLFPLLRNLFARLMNNYVRRPEVIDGLDEYIQPPQLGGLAGVLGGVVLAEQAALTVRL
jgi:fructokinase